MSDMTLPGHAATRARTAAEEARHREERLAWKLAAPAIILTVLLILLPTAAVIFWSLTNFELGYDGFEFIGLENYAELFSDRTFLISLKNTAVYTAIVAPASVFLGLGVALLIEGEVRGKSFFRTVYFLPVASLLVAMATVWQYLLHPTLGPVNAMLGMIGIAGPNWLGSSETVLFSLALIGIWQSVGFNMVLFWPVSPPFRANSIPQPKWTV
ncbi:hypothetical protein C005_02862 [Brucella melitensis BG2 (S27)]|nr:hypothetical protein C005_02862 [Brucella melitensis BG2 (S27)]